VLDARRGGRATLDRSSRNSKPPGLVRSVLGDEVEQQRQAEEICTQETTDAAWARRKPDAESRRPEGQIALFRPLSALRHSPSRPLGVSSDYGDLLEFYVAAVVPTFVPVHTERNPWLRYPSIALYLSQVEGKHHLLHSLLAHASFALATKGYKQMTMTRAALNFQSKSVAGLRSCIETNTIECLDLLTTILSLLLIEVSTPIERCAITS
jgi:hypothetical protein